MKNSLLRRAKLLMKLAKTATDPDLAASLIQGAADLKEIADNLAEPDIRPHAPDIERKG
jgi:hypothetical protein